MTASDLDRRRRSIVKTDVVRQLGLEDLLAYTWFCQFAGAVEQLPPWAQQVIADGEREVEERRVSDPKWYAHFIEGDYDPGDLDGVVPVWCDACDWEGEPGDVLDRQDPGGDRRPHCPACGAVVRLFIGWSFGTIPPGPRAAWLWAWEQRPSATPPPEARIPFRFTLDRETGDELVICADNGLVVWREHINENSAMSMEMIGDRMRRYLGADFGGLDVTPSASVALERAGRGPA